MFNTYDNSYTHRATPEDVKELMEDIERSEARLERLHEEHLELGVQNHDNDTEYKRLRLAIADKLDLRSWKLGELEPSQQVQCLTDKQLVSAFQKAVKIVVEKIQSGELSGWQLEEMKSKLYKSIAKYE